MRYPKDNANDLDSCDSAIVAYGPLRLSGVPPDGRILNQIARARAVGRHR
jgi:hypothetical protein